MNSKIGRRQSANINGSRTQFGATAGSVGRDNVTVPDLRKVGPELMGALGSASVATLRDAAVLTIQTNPDSFGEATMVAKMRVTAMDDPSKPLGGAVDTLETTQFQVGGILARGLFEQQFPDMREGDSVAYSSYAANAYAHMLPYLHFLRNLAGEGGLTDSIERALAAIPIPTLLAESLDSCLDIVCDGIVIRVRPYGHISGYNEAAASYVIRELLTSEIFTRLSSASGGGGTTPLSAVISKDIPVITGDDARAAIDLCFRWDEDEGRLEAGIELEYNGLDQSIIVIGPAATISDDAFRKLCLCGLIRLKSTRTREQGKLDVEITSDTSKMADSPILAAYAAASMGTPIINKKPSLDVEFSDDKKATISETVHEWWQTWDDTTLSKGLADARFSSGDEYRAVGRVTPRIAQIFEDLSSSYVRFGTSVGAAAQHKVLPVSSAIVPLTARG